MPEYKCEHCHDTGTCPTKPGIRTRWACQDCDAGRCKTCGGLGVDRSATSSGDLVGATWAELKNIPPCPDCNGSGDTMACSPCQKCGGSGDALPMSSVIVLCPDCNTSKKPEQIDTSDQCGDATDMIVPPPEGHGTWLDAAIWSTDWRDVWSAPGELMGSKQMRAAARAELAELRAHANAHVNRAWDDGYKTGKCAGAREAKERNDA